VHAPHSLGFVLFVVAVAIANIAWQRARATTVLNNWATQTGFTILRREYRYVRLGPFFWMTARGQTVLYVVVLDGSQRIRSAWVRCGSWWFGQWSDQIEVRWVDDTP
jgi:hypothetical protein